MINLCKYFLFLISLVTVSAQAGVQVSRFSVDTVSPNKPTSTPKTTSTPIHHSVSVTPSNVLNKSASSTGSGSVVFTNMQISTLLGTSIVDVQSFLMPGCVITGGMNYATIPSGTNREGRLTLIATCQARIFRQGFDDLSTNNVSKTQK